MPKDSCDVITLNVCGVPNRLHYSMRHKAFNVYDFFNQDDVNECKITIIAWAYIPKWWGYIGDKEQEEEA